MNDLLCVQQQLQHYILSGNSAIGSSIVDLAPLPIETRLAIYGDGYRLRLVESLAISYPALYAYLGTDEFNTLCLAYINSHPSPHRSIRWYGDELAQFVTHYYDQNYQFLAELADFEWAMTLAFDARDECLLTLNDVARLSAESWPDLVFRLHPSLQLVQHYWNSIHLWQTLIADDDIPKISKEPKATQWVLWRASDKMIRFYSLGAEEAWLLHAVAKGHDFAALCEGLGQWVAPEDIGLSAASYLKNWLQNGMITQVA